VAHRNTVFIPAFMRRVYFFGRRALFLKGGSVMASMGSYKLKDFILGGISQFSDYRKGNLTYGEIMYVMECVLDEFRGQSEKDARSLSKIKGLKDAPSFTTLLSIMSRLVETMVKKGMVGSREEAYILHGDE
jgi:hypothetical protein